MPDKPDTYFFAKISGDRNFILQLKQKLIDVYGEDPHGDLVWNLDFFAEAGSALQEAIDRVKNLNEALEFTLKVNRKSNIL